MKKYTAYIFISLISMLLMSCSGIRYFSIETHEPAQVTLPVPIRSLLITNNVVEQPEDVGHNEKRLGKRDYDRTKASSDSIAIYYTEALAQFLSEEEYFDTIKYYNEPLRKDKSFWQEFPILPEKMYELRQETGTDAIVSLDKLLIETYWTDYYQTQGYKYAALNAKIQSTIRVYLPSLDGKIPAVQFIDSLHWEGYEIRDDGAFAEIVVPTQEDAMKELAVYAAEKMVKVFSPHWEVQDRWYYTPMNSKMREGEVFAKNNQWEAALNKWNEYYEKEKNKSNRAKAAHNIALAYEMLDDMTSAQEWAEQSVQLFIQSTSGGSNERRRSLIYQKELERRVDLSNKLNMQLEE